MKNSTFILGSWIALFAAILAWGGVGFFAYDLINLQSERAAYTAEAAAANLQEGQAAQMRALARETVTERTALAKAADVDVLAAVNMIETVRAGAVLVNVTSAQADKVVAGKNGGASVNTVILNAHAEGPFSSLMQIAKMLETLPLATTVQTVEFGRSPADGTKNAGATWTLNVRLKFFTTVALSS